MGVEGVGAGIQWKRGEEKTQDDGGVSETLNGEERRLFLPQARGAEMEGRVRASAGEGAKHQGRDDGGSALDTSLDPVWEGRLQGWLRSHPNPAECDNRCQCKARNFAKPLFRRTAD